MIDSAMLNSILDKHCVVNMGPSTAEFFLAIAQTVWREAQQEEREACAQICESMSWPRCVDHYYAKDDAADECAAAIRARGETK